MGVGLMVALAAGWASTASGASSSHHRDPHSGTVAGVVVLIEHGARGSVEVFDAAGRLVAQRYVRWGRSQRMRQYPEARFTLFRVVLKPGRYDVELQLESGAWPGCPYEKTARVRASRTTHVALSEGCENTYQSA
jgi:hypothetical protein